MLVNGSDLMAFIAPADKVTDISTAVSVTRSIGAATSHTLNINMTTREITHKDKSGRWKYSDFGQMDWSVSAEGFIIDKQQFNPDRPYTNTADNKRHGYGMTDLYNMIISREPVYLVFALEADSEDFRNGKLFEPKEENDGWTASTKNYLGGFAWITAVQETAPVGEYSTYSVEFEGNGELKLVTPDDLTVYNTQTPVVVTTAKKTSNSTSASAESK